MSRNTAYVLCSLAGVALLTCLAFAGAYWVAVTLEQNGWFAVFQGAKGEAP